MEIRMTVHVPRRRPRPVDVVVSAEPGARAAALRSALGDHLGLPVQGLAVAGIAVDDDTLIGMPPLLDGVSVAVVTPRQHGAAGGAGDRPRPVLELVCTAGPDAGRAWPLAPPGLDVGRAPERGASVDDPSMSRTHVRVEVGPDGVRVRDLGSTNGVLVDGSPVDGSGVVDTSSTVVVGASRFAVRRAAGAGVPVTHAGDGTARIAPGRSLAPDPVGVVVDAPPSPPDARRSRVPWVAALAPLPVVLGLAVFLGPHLLLFALFGPLALVSTAVVDRVTGRRRARQELTEHRTAMAAARVRFDDAVAAEWVDRHHRHPGPADVLTRVEVRLPGLWGGPDDLTVRLGLGDVPTRTLWREDGALTREVARGVPVVLDLRGVRCLGVVAPPGRGVSVVAAVVGQLLVRLPPSRLRTHVLSTPAPPDADPPVPWDLVPHSRGRGQELLVVEDAARVEDVGARVAAALDAGGAAVVAASRASDLPDGCGAVLVPAGGGEWLLTTPDGEQTLVADGVGTAWRERLVRGLAPLREETADAGLPSRLELGDLGVAPLTPEEVLDRWSRACGPRAVVGTTGDGPLVTDLATDGPHVLVGGTTGSGKSEFLRTLVTGLTLASPPEDLTVLLVDFKGGAAFGPCAALPHVVGLVSDLDAHLADRVLRSLGAELRRRERLLADAGASDLEAYRATNPREPVPRLVVVVDELRTMVDELPDVVRELVRLAAQGRSLGIHLVLATQRPAGAVTPEVAANVNLRIAFRVKDRADAAGIVEDLRPVDLPPDVPGRGVARGGDGRLVEFQAALVSPPRVPGPPLVTVRAAGERTADRDRDRTAETAAVVGLVAAAFARRGGEAPRRPWLPPLPETVRRTQVPKDAFALSDDPDRQRRTPLTWSEGTPLWRIVGRPRSGRSTAVRALAVAAIATRGADRLHVQVIGSAEEHRDLLRLPHVGGVVEPTDLTAVHALVDHLASASGSWQGEASPTTLLVVDGWERLVEQDASAATTTLSAQLLRVLRDGAGHGLVAAVAGGRDLLRSSWSALGGEVLLLGDLDPLDVALAGLPAAARPVAGRPGRGVVVRDGLEVQVVAPEPVPGAVPLRGSAVGPAPWRYRPLPSRVERTAIRQDPVEGWLVGVAAPTAEPWSWMPERQGRRLLVSGPPGSGRTSALRVIAESAASTGATVAVVDGNGREVPASEAGGVVRVRRDDVERLVDLRRRHPDLVVLVDDADRLDGSPMLGALTEVGELVDRDLGALAVVTTPSALRTRFRGLDVDVAAHRLALLLQPGSGDGEALGVRRLPVEEEGPAGRGLVVLRGTTTHVQVLAPATRTEPVAGTPVGRPTVTATGR